MDKISEFDICTYRNTIVFELSSNDLEADEHERMIEILYDVIQNEFADKIKIKFNEALIEEHCYESQRIGRR